LSKTSLKPSTFLSPVPVVMVSSGTMDKSNIMTIAWAGVINSEPPMLSVSIRKERLSHEIISESGKFVVNLVSEDLVKCTDFCGVKSGRDVDKFEQLKLTKEAAPITGVPAIGESPVWLECEVRRIEQLGSHDMFIAEIVGVHINDVILDEKGAADLEKAHLVTYSHGEYWGLGKYHGFFGYSIAGEEALKRRFRK